MASEPNLINEQIAAHQTLLAGARRVNATLPTFSTWLMAGFGAAFTLALVNIETVSKFIEITHIRFGLVLFLVSLVLAVLGTYLGTIVTVALAAQEDGEMIGKKISESKQKFDLSMFAREYERGLFPLIRWVAHSAMKKAMYGDVVAGARMTAKLSQLQTLMVVAQGVLAVVAAGAVAVGLKMQ
jgi:hypothetical protein